MYEVIWSETASKVMGKLPRSTAARIHAALDRIRVRPEAYVTRLVGIPGYKFRVGDYRLILDIERQRLVIWVLKVGHRKDIYERI